MKNIIFNTTSDTRFFIDIAEIGCGNGCKYCYTKKPKAMQELVPYNNFLTSLDYLETHPGYKPGMRGSLISLCPDTEPLKSEAAVAYVTAVLKKFLPLGNPIQISTKEMISGHLLEDIDRLRLYQNQVIFFISSSTISKAKEIEPNAAPIETRIKNIESLKKYNIPSCLYVKPILSETLKDQDRYIEIIKKFKPTYICLGIHYIKNMIKDTVFNHPVHPHNLNSYGVDSRVRQFKQELGNIPHIKIFYSATCVTAYAIDWYSVGLVWRDFKELCTNCRNCTPDYQEYLRQKVKRMRLFTGKVRNIEELEKKLSKTENVPQKYSVAVEALIFDAAGRWILMERGADCRDEIGKLEGIGGKFENDPNFREALAREIREEVGDEANIEILNYFETRKDTVYVNDSPKHWIIVSYLCLLKSGELKICEPGFNKGFYRYFPDEIQPAKLSSSAKAAFESIKKDYPLIKDSIKKREVRL